MLGLRCWLGRHPRPGCQIYRLILSAKRIRFVTHRHSEGKSLHGKADWLTPGTFVRSPGNPDWGLGQVQSVISDKATVNFENAGKLVIRLDAVALTVVDPADLPQH
jgi:hypothetical protein